MAQFDLIIRGGQIQAGQGAAGGKRLRQEADGFAASVVGGQVTNRDGLHTGALPGKLVLAAQSASITAMAAE